MCATNLFFQCILFLPLPPAEVPVRYCSRKCKRAHVAFRRRFDENFDASFLSFRCNFGPLGCENRCRSDCNSYRNWRDAIDVPNFNAPTFVINGIAFISDTFLREPQDNSRFFSRSIGFNRFLTIENRTQVLDICSSNESSVKRNRMEDLPTPLSPMSNILKMWSKFGGWSAILASCPEMRGEGCREGRWLDEAPFRS